MMRMMPAMSAEQVAAIGYRGYRAGKNVVVTCGAMNRIMALSSRFAPPALLAAALARRICMAAATNLAASRRFSFIHPAQPCTLVMAPPRRRAGCSMSAPSNGRRYFLEGRSDVAA